jgi:hypothetical protein
MATLYYNAAVDTDWNTLGNWWSDSIYSVPATSLPSSADDVIMIADCLTNSGSGAIVNTLTFDGGPFNGSVSGGTATLGINITVIQVSEYYTIAMIIDAFLTGTLTASKVYLTGSYYSGINNGIINGSVLLNSLGYNNGTINGNATFGAGGYNNGSGSVNGNAIFEASSVNEGYIGNNATFIDMINYGYVNGNAIFYGGATNSNTINQHATFNDYSYNNFGGAVTGDATFNDSSYNDGVTGNATFNDTSYNNYGTVDGDATFNDSSYNSSNGPVTGNATFNGNSLNNGIISGDATFNGTSSNFGVANDFGTAVFNDSSTNENSGLIGGGGAIFNDSSFAYPTSAGSTYNGTVTFQNRTPYPLKRGVNGSNLLGIV